MQLLWAQCSALSQENVYTGKSHGPSHTCSLFFLLTGMTTINRAEASSLRTSEVICPPSTMKSDCIFFHQYPRGFKLQVPLKACPPLATQHYATLIGSMRDLFCTASSATKPQIWNWAPLRGFGISEDVKVLYQSKIHTALEVGKRRTDEGKRRADETVVSCDLFLQFIYLPLM